MKFLALLLASACSTYAADFVTGQAARLIIGQPNFTSQTPGASSTLLGAVGGLALVNDRLIVVDSNRVQAEPVNNRVLIYNNLSSKVPSRTASLTADRRCPVCGGEADVVVGQVAFDKVDIGLTQSTLRTPTGVATDGRVMAVADTDNNRVLIWNNIPTSNGVPADVVIGQQNFTTNVVNFGGSADTPSAKGLRGPQGVWIQDGRLYVADTQNHRVLMWNRIPAENGREADLVLGKPNFTTYVEVDLSQAVVEATASTLLNPVSVTSDGQRLYVADLGHNRVVVWNSIPTSNGQAADIALGQPDLVSTQTKNATAANNVFALCAPIDKDANGNDLYPFRCAATLEFPRYALSDGQRLFIADGGNNRILVYNSVPTNSGQAADLILGQRSDQTLEDSSSQSDDRRSAADNLRTPMALAWDGQNLFVSDPYNRRVLAFTLGDSSLSSTSVRNAASQDIFAIAVLQFTQNPKENDEITLKIGEVEYKFKTAANQTVANVINGLAEAINGGAGDPLVFGTPNLNAAQLILTAKTPGGGGNTVAYTITLTAGAQLAVQPLSGSLAGGQDAARLAPGSLVSILGQNLADGEFVAPPDSPELPNKLGGIQVYFDGLPAPLLYVSPTQINAQLPYEVSDASSSSAYVRRERPGGVVETTAAIAVPIVPENPGIFAFPGIDPRPAIAYHGSSSATGLILVGGTPKDKDVATVLIEDREYSYTITASDTLVQIRDALVQAINADEKVFATAAGGTFPRILLQARVPGVEGEGIAYSIKPPAAEATILLTASTERLCCALGENVPITEANPALPGETIIIYATGLGFVQPDEAKYAVITGGKYEGPQFNYTNSPIDAIAGGRTANVVFAGLKRGAIGIYEVRLQLNTSIPDNPQTQLTIAQDIRISNIVTFAVKGTPTPE